MIKTIVGIGTSQGLIVDAALRDLTGLQVGDQVDITVREDGSTACATSHTTPMQSPC